MNSLDKKKILEAYQTKVEEYKKYTSDELKKIYEESKTDKKKRIGGIYRVAFMDVLTSKLQEESLKDAVESAKESKPTIEENKTD
jgi:hypothetical protein